MKPIIVCLSKSMLWNALFLIVERKPPLDKSQQIKEGYLGPGSQINCPITSAFMGSTLGIGQQATALPWLIATLILASFSHHFPSIDPWQRASALRL